MAKTKMLLLDSCYNTVEVDPETVYRIMHATGFRVDDIKRHSTRAALFDDIRAYLKRKED